jgi:hypothetical protein
MHLGRTLPSVHLGIIAAAAHPNVGHHCSLICRQLPPSSASWDAATAGHLARAIAEVAAGQAADAQFRSPWAVELAERMPQVRGDS